MMRFCVVLFLYWSLEASSQQQESATMEEHLQERISDIEASQLTNDEGAPWDRGMRLLRRLPINRIDPAELGELMGLTPLQVQAFDTYRKQLGPFVDPLELQAIPGWDEATVRRVLPWAEVGELQSFSMLLRDRWQAGIHAGLLRTGLSTADMAERAGVQHSGQPYFGGAAPMLLRYGYAFERLMQWGFTMEKDAGERMLGKSGRSATDFFSWHWSFRDWKGIRTLVIGDYQASLGQGLAHWQGMAFRKTSEAMMVLRQGPSIKPYTGTDENRFHRGLAVEWGKRRWVSTAFVSKRALDANRVTDAAGIGEAYVSSLLTSGLHRTEAEWSDRDALDVHTVGGRIANQGPRARLGVNLVSSRFSLPIRKEPLPYNLYAVSGKGWSNISADYGISFRNAYFFGELARDGKGGKGLICGAMVTVHPRLDLSWVVRAISPRYHALQANAFTEQADPSNEIGHYAAFTLRLPGGWKADAWIDAFRFPWLRYRVDRPSKGISALVNLTWTPDKKNELAIRWQREVRGQNSTQSMDPMHPVLPACRTGLRIQYTYRPSPEWMVRARVETSRAYADNIKDVGFLCYFDLQCRPREIPLQLIGRLVLFETDGYASRIYGFENDVPYRQSMGVYYGKAARAYLVGSWQMGRSWKLSCKLGSALRKRPSEESMADTRLQVIWNWADSRRNGG